MELRAYLNSIGITDIDAFRRKTRARNVELIKSRVEFYKKRLNLTNDELVDMISLVPPLLGYSIDPNDPTSVANKIDFYQKVFKFSDKELSKFIQTCPPMLSLSIDENEPSSFQGKMDYFKIRFRFSEEEILKNVKHTPALFTHGILGYEEKFKFYKETFGITEKETAKMIKNFPNLLIYDMGSVKEKVEIYKETLHCSEKEICHIIQSSPSYLSYDVTSDSPTSVKSKIKWYSEIFNISQDRVCQMIKSFPGMLCYGIENSGETSVSEKLKYLRQIADKEDIVLNPVLLSHPALKVKIRYLILSRVFDKNIVIGNRKMTTNEAKLWARLKYLEGQKFSLKNVYLVESRFSKITGKSSDELIKQYPLTAEDIDMMEREHLERTGEKIIISPEERKAVLQSSDEKEME